MDSIRKSIQGITDKVLTFFNVDQNNENSSESSNQVESSSSSSNNSSEIV